MGIAESIALAGVALAGVAMVGSAASSAIKALWSISKGLGSFEGQILEILKRHNNQLLDHEDRIRSVEDAIK